MADITTKCYFDRTEPYYISKVPTFDGIEVKFSARLIDVLESRQATLAEMDDLIARASAPEESAQRLADEFAAKLEKEIQLAKPAPSTVAKNLHRGQKPAKKTKTVKGNNNG